MPYALYELPAGFALFKVSADGSSNPKLTAFKKFKGTKDALEAVTQLINGEMSKPLSKFLKKNLVEKGITDELIVMDKKLASAIHAKLDLPCVHREEHLNVFRQIKAQVEKLVETVSAEQMHQASLGLAHSVNRYKLKFSPDKIDLMIVQAISLLQDLDKEINKYAMRLKEWYGWHFPELAKIVVDNHAYAKLVIKLRQRNAAETMDMSDILEEEEEAKVKDAATHSMGTEISEDDLDHVVELALEVASSFTYRDQLAAYLADRMRAIAPTLTLLLGETLGAKLIAHAGSLSTLAKYPASTVQIIGAEKALFRAMKLKQHTPKYGILYHATLVAKAPQKNKGTMARVLAGKTSLAVRADAFADSDNIKANEAFGLELKEMAEARFAKFDSSLAYGATGKARGSTAGKYDRNEEQEKTKKKGVSADDGHVHLAISEEQPKKKKKKEMDEDE